MKIYTLSFLIYFLYTQLVNIKWLNFSPKKSIILFIYFLAHYFTILVPLSAIHMHDIYTTLLINGTHNVRTSSP